MNRFHASPSLLALALTGCAPPNVPSRPPSSLPTAPTVAPAATPAHASALPASASPSAPAPIAPPPPPPRSWNLGTSDAIDVTRLGDLVAAFEGKLLEGQVVDLSAAARALGADPHYADRLTQVAPWRAQMLEANLDEDSDVERVVDIVACGTSTGDPPDTTPDPSQSSARQCRGQLIHLIAWIDPGPKAARALGFQVQSFPYDVNGDNAVTLSVEPVHSTKHQDTIMRVHLRLESGTTEVTDELDAYALRGGRVEKILEYQNDWTISHVGGKDRGHRVSLDLTGNPPRVFEATDEITHKKTLLHFDPVSFRYR